MARAASFDCTPDLRIPLIQRLEAGRQTKAEVLKSSLHGSRGIMSDNFQGKTRGGGYFYLNYLQLSIDEIVIPGGKSSGLLQEPHTSSLRFSAKLPAKHEK